MRTFTFMDIGEGLLEVIKERDSKRERKMERMRARKKERQR